MDAPAIDEFTSQQLRRIAADEEVLRQFQQTRQLANVRSLLTEKSRAAWVSLTTNVDLLDDGWRKYTQALRTTITGGTDWENLQIVTDPPEPIQWDDRTFGDYYFHVVAGDTMQENGASYRKSDRMFFERYNAFVTDIHKQAPDEAGLLDAQKYLTKARDASKVHAELEETLAKEWQAYDDRQRQLYPNQPSHWHTMEWYYTDRRNYEALDASTRIVDGWWGIYYSKIQEAYHGQETLFVDIIDRLKNTSKVDLVEPRYGNREGKPAKVPAYKVTPNFPDWLAAARAGDTSQKVEFTVDHQSGSYDYSRTGCRPEFGWNSLRRVSG